MVQGGSLHERAVFGPANLPAGDDCLPLRLLDGFEFFMEQPHPAAAAVGDGQEGAVEVVERLAGLEVLEQNAGDPTALFPFSENESCRCRKVLRMVRFSHQRLSMIKRSHVHVTPCRSVIAQCCSDRSMPVCIFALSIPCREQGLRS